MNEEADQASRRGVRHDVQPAHQPRVPQDARDGSERRVWPESASTNWIITDWYRTQAYYDSGGLARHLVGRGRRRAAQPVPAPAGSLAVDLRHARPRCSRIHAHIGKWHDIEVEDDVTAYVEYRKRRHRACLSPPPATRPAPTALRIQDGPRQAGGGGRPAARAASWRYAEAGVEPSTYKGGLRCDARP